MSELETLPSRYVVGIDLGTTNSAVALVDTHHTPWQVKNFALPQLVAPGQIEARDTLPSFLYQPAAAEQSAGALRMGWDQADLDFAVGVYARDQGALVPGRLVASAKSWLSHSGVDRLANLLPWHAAPDVERMSPVAASAKYLAHLRAAWDARFKSHPLAEQDVVLTLPASFDEVARELTIAAAAQAGLPRVVLIEEPQAAFYAWINNHASNWESLVTPGQKILVCDIGGGTSDFTLIRVRRGEGEKVQFHRVAVGEHLILGGDNLDLALAHHLEAKLTSGGKLDPRPFDVLVRMCRQVKEILLGENPPETYTFNLPGSGSRLIGGGTRVEVTRDEVRQVLLEGFFPQCELTASPQRRRSGFQEFGLPYATDPGITRYLASFLTTHRHAGDEASEPASKHDPARPDIVLFNGGVFESPEIRERVVAALQGWFADKSGGDADYSPIVLENERLDLAVARGAAYYGMVRRGEGIRIAAGLARTYYIGFESEPPAAICLVPGNAEPGQNIDLSSRTFDLLVSQPVEFPLYVSSTRLVDRPGDVLPVDREQMTALPPIRTALRTRRKGESPTAQVQLHARLTEIGTLDLWCAEVQGERQWRLQFDVRSTTQTDIAAHASAAEGEGFVDEGTWQKVAAVIAGVFGPGGQESPDGIVKRLTKALEQERSDWPTSLLRRIAETLLEHEAGRRRSVAHEARWLNLLGYCLRPGYGLAVDDWRVNEVWRVVQGKLAHGAANIRAESLILWRRVAGGLSPGQQRAVAEPLLAPVRALHRRLSSASARADLTLSPQESNEAWRLLGSLELLPATLKLEMGDLMAELLPKKKLEPVRPALAWALGRLGQRVPQYGPLNTVVPPEHAQRWAEVLMALPGHDPQHLLAVMQLARHTGDRYRDLEEADRREIAAWLTTRESPPHLIDLVTTGGELEAEEQGRVFGEALPKGLRIL
jgi:molecular chaperone DnaK (HSP70)